MKMSKDTKGTKKDPIELDNKDEDVSIECIEFKENFHKKDHNDSDDPDGTEPVF